jgi:secreted trypsin-like serine protease
MAAIPQQQNLNLNVFLAPKHVMTAAHCADGVFDHQVTLGAHDISNQNEATQVTIGGQATVHPGWNPSTLANDIAIITLDHAVTCKYYTYEFNCCCSLLKTVS